MAQKWTNVPHGHSQPKSGKINSMLLIASPTDECLKGFLKIMLEKTNKQANV